MPLPKTIYDCTRPLSKNTKSDSITAFTIFLCRLQMRLQAFQSSDTMKLNFWLNTYQDLGDFVGSQSNFLEDVVDHLKLMVKHHQMELQGTSGDKISPNGVKKQGSVHIFGILQAIHRCVLCILGKCNPHQPQPLYDKNRLKLHLLLLFEENPS